MRQWRKAGRAGGTVGAAGLEYVGLLVVLATVVALVAGVVLRARPDVTAQTAAAVCRVLDVGDPCPTEAAGDPAGGPAGPALADEPPGGAQPASPQRAALVADGRTCTETVVSDRENVPADDFTAPHTYWVETYACSYEDGSQERCSREVRRYSALGIGTWRSSWDCERTEPPAPVAPPPVDPRGDVDCARLPDTAVATEFSELCAVDGEPVVCTAGGTVTDGLLIQPDPRTWTCSGEDVIADECGNGVALSPAAAAEADALEPLPTPLPGGPVPPGGVPTEAPFDQAALDREIAAFAQFAYDATGYDAYDAGDRGTYLAAFADTAAALGTQRDPGPLEPVTRLLDGSVALTLPPTGPDQRRELGPRTPQELCTQVVTLVAILGVNLLTSLYQQYGPGGSEPGGAQVLIGGVGALATAGGFIGLNEYNRVQDAATAARSQVDALAAAESVAQLQVAVTATSLTNRLDELDRARGRDRVALQAEVDRLERELDRVVDEADLAAARLQDGQRELDRRLSAVEETGRELQRQLSVERQARVALEAQVADLRARQDRTDLTLRELMETLQQQARDGSILPDSAAPPLVAADAPPPGTPVPSGPAGTPAPVAPGPAEPAPAPAVPTPAPASPPPLPPRPGDGTCPRGPDLC